MAAGKNVIGAKKKKKKKKKVSSDQLTTSSILGGQPGGVKQWEEEELRAWGARGWSRDKHADKWTLSVQANKVVNS